jgi:hypothetical protein
MLRHVVIGPAMWIIPQNPSVGALAQCRRAEAGKVKMDIEE